MLKPLFSLHWGIPMQHSWLFAILLTTGLSAWHTQASPLVLGKTLNKSASVEVNQLVTEPARFHGQTVTVHGTVSAVCQKKGCWLQLQTGTSQPIFRLEVNDGELVFPVSAHGKTAYASGTLQVENLTLQQTQDYLAHRAAEQGNVFDVSMVHEPLTILRLRPQAVLIE